MFRVNGGESGVGQQRTKTSLGVKALRANLATGSMTLREEFKQMQNGKNPGCAWNSHEAQMKAD